jgi:hypothetical protein
MAMFVGGVQVTGTQTLDATKLTGNLPAISGASLTALTAANVTANGTLPALNGSNLTSLPAASAVPVVSVGTVGSYAMCGFSRSYNYAGGNNQNNGTTFNGAVYSNSSGTLNSGSASGTWRNNGGAISISTNAQPASSTVCQRIS